MARTSKALTRLKTGGVFASVLVALTVFSCLPACAETVYPGKHWKKARSPEELGWSSEKLQKARRYSETIGSAAVMIIVDGVILDEWGETTRRFKCHSVRKSFLSALYGIHVHEGHINLDDTLEELGIDDNEPSLTAREKQATVRDLLQARSGVYHPALYETAGMKARRPRRGSHPPGTFWYYNNWDFNALGTIFEQETGKRIFEEFKRRLADPLQMEDFRLEDGSYFQGPDSIHPAYPFRMSARDMARFGLLYLRNGEWQGQQIIPAAWVAESTQSYSDTGSPGRRTGYGYMWWVLKKSKRLGFSPRPERAYYASGYRGHKILVVPSEDLVIVHRVNTDLPAGRVTSRQFFHLVKLILQAKSSPKIERSTPGHPRIQEGEKALECARKVVALIQEKNAAYLDIRAQAYSVNEELPKAIETIRKAISVVDPYDRYYYEYAWEKFEQALRRERK